ncbi:type IV pilus biogenesis protein PilP [Salmonella enterica subsp. diarizonae]|uniref:Type IV pilus biogenesis protein PilP n=2 Tax=Salmonella enterica TaxID=28901 RepID=A0A759YPH0_SALER|nr:type IV pilus biogenesis protein PilP [Salmonella enterica subsp. diarizonae]EBG1930754.1 type IV pilus biogenesis protein PilP [Salmonella enterica]ECF1922811.1 type IV pilus biogenesis protein PilP [Salmonella enterica subsp. enterica serovar Newport]HEB6456440.1 type IV pilus biogenesis protein PilP [Salmonella enterica subsp. enterica serovar Hvittingfoss]EBI1479136.1 type IV pilus biogenesis protein PilP [Salmonella enterica]
MLITVRNKAARAAAGTTAVLMLLVSLMAGGARAETTATAPGQEHDTPATEPVVPQAQPPEETVVRIPSPVTEATPPVPLPGSITLGMLEDVQQKNLLLAAQVQTAQLERQLAEAGSDAPAGGATAPSAAELVSSVPGAGRTDSPVASRVKDAGAARPQVLEISGKDNTLYALLQMPDGSQPEVTRGSRVTIGKTSLTVSRISLTGVMLSDGSELSF